MTTFKRSCRTCGWSNTYAFAKRADYGKKIHSCDRHLEKAASAERRRDRLAAVDRTPKPCQHKVAEHVHGTHPCYVLDACRCLPCSAANAAYEGNRARQNAYGRSDYIDAEPSREHIRGLMDQGMGLKRIVAVTDLSQGMLWKLLYGKKRADGTRVPTVRVRKATEARILAITLDLAEGARIDSTGSRRRIQALVCLGYSIRNLGERLGIQSSNMHSAVHDRGLITVRTATAITALYDELSMTPNEPAGRYDRCAASRARNYAATFGWLPPLAWDEDSIDDPMMQPEPVNEVLSQDTPLDEVAIMRRYAGDKTVKLTKAEKVELAIRWRAAGRSHRDWEQVVGYAQFVRYLDDTVINHREAAA